MASAQHARSARALDELVELAARLAEADERLRYLLVKARKDARLSQREVAAALGIKQSSVAAFERHDNDPRLSTIRRYALAVGARVDHRVSCDAWDGGWTPVRPEATIDLVWAAQGGQFTHAAPAELKRTDFATAA